MRLCFVDVFCADVTIPAPQCDNNEKSVFQHTEHTFPASLSEHS